MLPIYRQIYNYNQKPLLVLSPVSVVVYQPVNHEHLKYGMIESKCGSPTLYLFLQVCFLISVIHCARIWYHLGIHRLSHTKVKHLPCPTESTKLLSCACWVCDASLLPPYLNHHCLLPGLRMLPNWSPSTHTIGCTFRLYI